MSTVKKALSILDLFSAGEAQLGLSEVARRSGFDKATTRRHLVALGQAGLIQQDEATKLYALGAGLSRLARVREAGFPFLRTALPLVRRLAALTEETVHLSELSAGMLATVHVEHPARANRVNVDVGGRLPFHCTASGLAVLAFSDERTAAAALAEPLEAFTAHTETTPLPIRRRLSETREKGFSLNRQGFEDGVVSVAAPVLDADNRAIGAIAVAAPLARSSDEAIAVRGKAVKDTARLITGELNGELRSDESRNVLRRKA